MLFTKTSGHTHIIFSAHQQLESVSLGSHFLAFIFVCSWHLEGGERGHWKVCTVSYFNPFPVKWKPYDICRAVYFGMWRMLKFFVLKPQHLWMAWDKDSRQAISGEAVSTGRKEAIELPAWRAGKSTWVGKRSRGCWERLTATVLSHLPQSIQSEGAVCFYLH